MTSSDCIFCKIAKGEIPSKKLYEDQRILAFEDTSPQAPVHFLIIPKEHIPTLDDIEEEHTSLIGEMMLLGAKLARKKGVAQEGYRQIINCREAGGQVVFHLHMHILGGRRMRSLG